MSASPETHTGSWQNQPAVRATQRRTVRCLAAAQVVGGVGIGVTSALGPLLAEAVAHSEALAGLARTATTVGAAAAGVPLAILAKRKGRRAALSTGWLTAAGGGLVLIAAAVVASLPLLVIGMLLFGIASATNQQSRYAAADLAAPHRRARSLSIVIWSTTIGAVIGPNLAGPGASIATALHLPRLTGAFLLATICMTAACFLLRIWLRPDPLLLAHEHAVPHQTTAHDTQAGSAARDDRSTQQHPADGGMRAVWLHLRHTPRAAFAFLTIVVANTVMGAVMTMTPVSMSNHGAALTIVGITISGHLLGMYAFAPVVGWLSDRFGTLAIALAGQVVFLASALSSGLSHGSVPWMMTGLFLLGLGWSFSLVAGSAMLTDATPTALHPAVQGTSDTAMNIVAALAAGLAGPLMVAIGFGGLNAVAAVLVLPVLIFSIFVIGGGNRTAGEYPGRN